MAGITFKVEIHVEDLGDGRYVLGYHYNGGYRRMIEVIANGPVLLIGSNIALTDQWAIDARYLVQMYIIEKLNREWDAEEAGRALEAGKDSPLAMPRLRARARAGD